MSAREQERNCLTLAESGRLVVAMLIPLAAFGLQWFFWNSFKPFAWIFFYPAVFFSAWIGGLRCGLASTAISTLVIWWFFIPNRYSFSIEQPAYAFPGAGPAPPPPGGGGA